MNMPICGFIFRIWKYRVSHTFFRGIFATVLLLSFVHMGVAQSVSAQSASVTITGRSGNTINYRANFSPIAGGTKQVILGKCANASCTLTENMPSCPSGWTRIPDGNPWCRITVASTQLDGSGNVSSSVNMSGLPVGPYTILVNHTNNPGSCSGNPTCSFNGGSATNTCSGFVSCHPSSDFQIMNIIPTATYTAQPQPACYPGYKGSASYFLRVDLISPTPLAGSNSNARFMLSFYGSSWSADQKTRIKTQLGTPDFQTSTGTEFGYYLGPAVTTMQNGGYQLLLNQNSLIGLGSGRKTMRQLVDWTQTEKDAGRAVPAYLTAANLTVNGVFNQNVGSKTFSFLRSETHNCPTNCFNAAPTVTCNASNGTVSVGWTYNTSYNVSGITGGVADRFTIRAADTGFTWAKNGTGKTITSSQLGGLKSGSTTLSLKNGGIQEVYTDHIDFGRSYKYDIALNAGGDGWDSEICRSSSVTVSCPVPVVDFEVSDIVRSDSTFSLRYCNRGNVMPNGTGYTFKFTHVGSGRTQSLNSATMSSLPAPGQCANSTGIGCSMLTMGGIPPAGTPNQCQTAAEIKGEFILAGVTESNVNNNAKTVSFPSLITPTPTPIPTGIIQLNRPTTMPTGWGWETAPKNVNDDAAPTDPRFWTDRGTAGSASVIILGPDNPTTGGTLISNEYWVRLKPVVGYSSRLVYAGSTVDRSPIYFSVRAGQTVALTGSYIQQTGTLRTTITGPTSARWQYRKGTTGDFLPSAGLLSGATVPNLAIGTDYQISFNTVTGWTKPQNIIGISITNGQTTTQTASYTEITYAITYNGNGNTGGTVPDNQTKPHGTSINLRQNSGNLVRTGYTFSGWNTLANGTGTSYQVGASYTIDANLTLYAQWTPNTLTVTYNTQGGSTIANGTTPVGGTIPASPGTPTRTGYTFNGWFLTATGGTTITFPYTHNQTANFTLYAQWTQQTGSLQVTIPAESGSSLPSDARWSLSGRDGEYQSGQRVDGIPTGTYNIVFKDVAGYDTPQSQQVTITANGQENIITSASYVRHRGTIVVAVTNPPADWRVELAPKRAADTNPPTDASLWQAYTSPIEIGTNSYWIRLKTVPGYNIEPLRNQSGGEVLFVTVVKNQTTSLVGTYVSTITPTPEAPTPTHTPVPPTPTDSPTSTPTTPDDRDLPIEDCPRFVEGDADCNDIINRTDYLCWKMQYRQKLRGETVTAEGSCRIANFSNENPATRTTVTLLDFAIWRVGLLRGNPLPIGGN